LLNSPDPVGVFLGILIFPSEAVELFYCCKEGFVFCIEYSTKNLPDKNLSNKPQYIKLSLAFASIEKQKKNT